ncbi:MULTISPECIES: DUF1217 domain-containing protein [unclassified Ensifer]|uniref:DUF1217 domain-containing protein n=1 Tax=unclassified Ensifer TaxID=2633371 RepID=UPI000813C254|nr:MULTISPECIES: DUF1217 domain-containing protein [unclassified Ensifer]OCP00299.1 hypothetical protein BC362_25010 [Ensifer sp. LC14]OCP07309.1 hypothetical protein BBX50_21865 [Ensifer sp. LC11]OCP08112.1 hypothetical protein BC374_22390 [Ensifer sp. LC13]OCP31948.1 hypothetical protein BC364_21645 [Ensifer sp. LC499]
MVSTYLDFSRITRDLRSSLNRIAQQPQIAREIEYYKENIGKVKTAEEFLDDYRLYSYAMKAHGLEDMTYAKAFMRKVLESDLSDDNSFANRLNDERYRNFAAAFSFSSSKPVAQTSAQLDALIGLYNDRINNLDTVMRGEMAYFGAAMDLVTDVDQFLGNERLREFAFPLFDLDPKTYSHAEIRSALTREPADLIADRMAAVARQDEATKLRTDLGNRITALREIDSLTAQLADAPAADKPAIQAKIDEQNAIVADLDARLPPRDQAPALMASLKDELDTLARRIRGVETYIKLAETFNFNSDGTVPAGEKAISDAKKTMLNERYVFTRPGTTPLGSDRLTGAGALLNKDYYEGKIGSITNVSDLVNDSRIFTYLVTAFGLSSTTTVRSTIENILTSDINDPNSYVNKFGVGDNAAYKDLHAAFNFQADGTLQPGKTAQDADQMKKTSDGYMVRYNDKGDAEDAAQAKSFKLLVNTMTSIDSLLNNSSMRQFMLRAFGLENEELSSRTLKRILTSDLNDPRSYANTLRDERYVKLVKAFNFNPDGTLGAPKLAQSQPDIMNTAKSYVIAMSRFGTDDEKKAAKEKAQAEAKYYATEIEKVETLDAFLKNRRLVDFALVSRGIDPETVKVGYLKDMFTSDLNDPKSFINTDPDGLKYRELVSSFNFDKDGKIVRGEAGQIQTRRGLVTTADLFLNQSLEESEGADNGGIRLALYFKRKAPEINTAYDILADRALFEVIKTAYSMPEGLQNAKIDAQAAYLERAVNIKDLQDPEKLEKLLQRFTALYDVENNTDVSPGLAILTGAGGGGVSAETLLSLSQLRTGGR